MKRTKQKKSSKTTLATAKKVLKYLRHYRLLLALSLIFATVVVVLTLYLPVLTGDALDLLVAGQEMDFDGIAAILQKSAVVILITAAAQWLMNVCNNRITCALTPSAASNPCPFPSSTAVLWATRSAASSRTPTSSPTDCSWAFPSSSQAF